jgi:hypothetical protein
MEFETGSDGKLWPKIYNFKTPEKWFIGRMGEEADKSHLPRKHWTRYDYANIEWGKDMKLVEFYRGERGNQCGHMLTDMLTWSNGALEMDHDYIQWMFGSNERSMLNGEAPTMTKEESEIFQNDPELREKVKQSLIRFLKFLAFKLSKDDEQVLIEPVESENTPWWLRGFNHNHLRVTRLLKCLRLTGNSKYAIAMFDALRPFKDKVSANTWQYWCAAIFDPLWPEVMEL